MNLVLGLKELGGVSVTSMESPANVVKGAHFKITLFIGDHNARPLTVTSYSVKLRIQLANDSIVEILGTHIDNNLGEMEFEITAAQSAQFKLGTNQSVEIELFKTADPTIKSFHKIESALNVFDKLFP